MLTHKMLLVLVPENLSALGCHPMSLASVMRSQRVTGYLLTLPSTHCLSLLLSDPPLSSFNCPFNKLFNVFLSPAALREKCYFFSLYLFLLSL